MSADKAMDADGARYRVGISIARTHKTSSGKTFTTFEPWAWEPWNYQCSRIDFLSIFMIFDLPGARALDALQALLALWPTATSSALTWPPPSTARRIAWVVVRRAMGQFAW
jgi:hypothetical protein